MMSCGRNCAIGFDLRFCARGVAVSQVTAKKTITCDPPRGLGMPTLYASPICGEAIAILMWSSPNAGVTRRWRPSPVRCLSPMVQRARDPPRRAQRHEAGNRRR